jgi:hypothetical protein
MIGDQRFNPERIQNMISRRMEDQHHPQNNIDGHRGNIPLRIENAMSSLCIILNPDWSDSQTDKEL